MENPSRREVLTVAAATVSIPMLQAAMGGMRQAAAAATGPATRPGSQPAAEKPGWFDTKLVAKDLKDKEFTAVDGHKVLVTRADKSITAMTNVCTHRQCAIKPTTGKDMLTCGCHQAQYNFDGTNAKGPATKPLQHYAVRINAAGNVEVDPGQSVAKDAKEATATLA